MARKKIVLIVIGCIVLVTGLFAADRYARNMSMLHRLQLEAEVNTGPAPDVPDTGGVDVVERSESGEGNGVNASKDDGKAQAIFDSLKLEFGLGKKWMLSSLDQQEISIEPGQSLGLYLSIKNMGDKPVSDIRFSLTGDIDMIQIKPSIFQHYMTSTKMMERLYGLKSDEISGPGILMYRLDGRKVIDTLYPYNDPHYPMEVKELGGFRLVWTRKEWPGELKVKDEKSEFVRTEDKYDAPYRTGEKTDLSLLDTAPPGKDFKIGCHLHILGKDFGIGEFTIHVMYPSPKQNTF